MTQRSSVGAQAKLSGALQSLKTCTSDTEIEVLGSVLGKLHGALEDHFRDVLIHNAPLSDLEKKEVRGDRGVQRTGWKSLADLMEVHFDLSRADRHLILDANGVRNKVSHGDILKVGELELDQLQIYAAFVQDCFDRTWTSVSSPHSSQSNSASPPRSPEYARTPPSQSRSPEYAGTSPSQSRSPEYAGTSDSQTRSPEYSRTSAPRSTPQIKYKGISTWKSGSMPTGTQWVINNITALLYSIVAVLATQFGVWIVVSIVEACNLAPSGSTAVIPPLAGLLMGAVCYFELQAAGLVQKPREWSIVSLMGVGMVYVPAMIMGWIGKAILPADNAFLSFIFLGGFGAALGLALGLAQYRVLKPHYDNIQSWIPASVLDWGLCMGFVPLLKLLRPEVQTSVVAGVLLPIAGFVLGKAVTGYQVRQLKLL